MRTVLQKKKKKWRKIIKARTGIEPLTLGRLNQWCFKTVGEEQLLIIVNICPFSYFEGGRLSVPFRDECAMKDYGGRGSPSLLVMNGCHICQDGMKNVDNKRTFNNTKLVHGCYLIKFFHSALINLALLAAKEAPF